MKDIKTKLNVAATKKHTMKIAENERQQKQINLQQLVEKKPFSVIEYANGMENVVFRLNVAV